MTFAMKHDQIKTYVESLDIAANGKYRSDCPKCGRKNTFSVTDSGFERMWYCFHADCHTSGKTGLTLSKSTAKDIFKMPKVTTESKPADCSFEIPHTFISLSRNPKAEDYVRKVGAYDAYLTGLADIQYDFKLDRVVYLIKDGNKVLDAVGRTLSNGYNKWYRYGNSRRPFVCGSNPIGIICEDCASACSVAEIMTGIALLGTNLLDEYVDIIKKFDKVYVALDKDATATGLKIVRQLMKYVDTSMIMLDKDLKDMRKEERYEILRSKTQ